GGVTVERVEVAVDELDGLAQVARRDGLPDLAEAAVAQRPDQGVTGDRFRARFTQQVHGTTRDGRTHRRNMAIWYPNRNSQMRQSPTNRHIPGERPPDGIDDRMDRIRRMKRIAG